MLKQTWFALAVITGLTTSVKAQDIQWWGTYQDGSHPIADHSLRFYAISYYGNLNDKNMIWAQATKAVTHLNKVDKTHEYKDGNGNFNEVRLGPDRVFVIGAYNPANGNHCWMATVPGRGFTVVTNDQGTLKNDGWLRRTWMTNGHKVHLQFGDFHGKLQWCVGYDN